MHFLGRLWHLYHTPLGTLYIAAFFYALHYFVTIYVHSSYLGQFLSDGRVGMVFAFAALLSIIALYRAPWMVEKLGNHHLLIFLATIELGISISIALVHQAFPAALLFTLLFVSSTLILYTQDLFLEYYSKIESHTGSIRGTYLTFINTALVVSPFLVGLLLDETTEYSRVYIFSAITLIPFLLIMSHKFLDFKNPPYHKLALKDTFCEIRKDLNLFSIFALQFLLRVFFSWMVIYLPLYLHNEIGFAWADIGFIFVIMVLPFALFELPAGKIADRYLGEKELLTGGLILMALTTTSFSLITSASLVLWSALLFVNRIGASLMEITTESYFFKHVDSEDTDLISAFRMLQPFSYIIGPFIATLALVFVDIQYVFIVFGITLLLGLWYCYKLVDTK